MGGAGNAGALVLAIILLLLNLYVHPTSESKIMTKDYD
jgi:hypothetical protein